MPIKNLNAYNQEFFEHSFKQTATYDLLKQKYCHVIFDKFFENRIDNRRLRSTPRQIYAYPESMISAVPWYYLDYLDSSQTMVDLGCGMNFFKPFFANLWGIGAEDQPDQFFGDKHDFVDDDFYRGHVAAFDSVFSINALHFNPIENIRHIATKFSAMLKPGGRGFLALNAKRMLEKSGLEKVNVDELESWLRIQFEDFPTKILVFDVDLSVLDAYMDGNVRIVFENTP
jgi:hypothetical protein